MGNILLLTASQASEYQSVVNSYAIARTPPTSLTPLALNNLALAYFQQGDTLQAHNALREAAKYEPSPLLDLLGLSLGSKRAAKSRPEQDTPASPAALLEEDLRALLIDALGPKRLSPDGPKKQIKKQIVDRQRYATAGRRGNPADVQRKLVHLLAWPTD